MFTCPSCSGRGTTPTNSEDPCKICFGRGVVLSLTSDCPVCGNRRDAPECSNCGDTGLVRVPRPFVSPVREIPVEALHRALETLRTGGGRLDSGDDAFVLGVASVLLNVSAERRDALGWCEGELFEGLKQGVLRLDMEGLWHFPDPTAPNGALIVRHPLSA